MDLEFQNSIYVIPPKQILVLNKHVMPATNPNGSDLNARLIRLDRIRTAKGWPVGQITGRDL